MSKSSLNPDLYLYPSRFWSRAGSKNLFGAEASMKKKNSNNYFYHLSQHFCFGSVKSPMH